MSAAPRPALLSRETLSRLGALSLLARQVPDAARRGRRRSRRVGQGTDTIDTRSYCPGDDVRRIDWGAYARFERLLVRVVADERPLRLGLLVDRSGSMAFGEPSKLTQACRLAAGLAAVAVAREDRVTLVDHADGRTRVRVRAGGGARGLRAVLRALEDAQAGGTTDLAGAAAGMRAVLGGGGLCAIVSDFLDPAGALAAAETLRRQGHDVALLRVLTAYERDPVGLDGATVEDEETGEGLALPSRGVRERYREVFDAHTAELTRGAARLGAPFLDVDASDAFDVVLAGALTRGLLSTRGPV